MDRRSRRPRCPRSRTRRGATATTAIRPVPAAELYAREPHLGPGALGALEIPDESIICPWTTPLAFATEAVRAGVRLRLRTRVTGVSAGRGLARAGDRRAGPLRCRWLVNAAGLGSDAVDAMFGGGGFTIRPRRGELIVFDKLARPLVGSILLPVPTAQTKGVLVAPTVYGNVLLGPTAQDVADRADTATTGRRAALAARRPGGGSCPGWPARRSPRPTRACGRRPSTATTRSGWTPARRYACVGGIRSTGLTASLGIAEYVAEPAGGGRAAADARGPAARCRRR